MFLEVKCVTQIAPGEAFPLKSIICKSVLRVSGVSNAFKLNENDYRFLGRKVSDEICLLVRNSSTVKQNIF